MTSKWEGGQGLGVVCKRLRNPGAGPYPLCLSLPPPSPARLLHQMGPIFPGSSPRGAVK